MGNYTKGEWKIEYPANDGIRARIIVGENGSVIATVNDEANAQLIASAPDLHEALKELLKWAELSYSDDTGEWADENDPAIVQTKKALARAEVK